MKSFKFVVDYVLNNVIYFLENIDQVSSKFRSIVECENVEVICNDLNESDKGLYMEDIESDIVFIILSFEFQCEFDVLNLQLEIMEIEMIFEELERLVQFIIGCLLIRYDCSFSECFQCLFEFYYNYQYYYDQGFVQFFQVFLEIKEFQEESLESEVEEDVEVIEESQSQVEDEVIEVEIIDINSFNEKLDLLIKSSKKVLIK